MFEFMIAKISAFLDSAFKGVTAPARRISSNLIASTFCVRSTLGEDAHSSLRFSPGSPSIVSMTAAGV